MRRLRWTSMFLLSLLLGMRTFAQAPAISGISPASGPVGMQVTIAGSNFGAQQGSSTVSLNSTSATVTNWSNSSVSVFVPTGAASGSFSVTVNSQSASSSTFTVTSLPSGWLDSDIGSVGVTGSATYANGTFTVKGGGTSMSGSSDSLHYAYLPLSGDGSIVARVVSVSGGSSPAAAVMIREALTPGSITAWTYFNPNTLYFFDRLTTNGSATYQTGSSNGAVIPYWLKVVRSGNAFSGYISPDGFTWSQAGSAVTITMAQNAYIGLALCGGSTTSAATANFDNVQVSSAVSPVPTITSLSATSASVGTEIAINGSNFGSTQGSSFVTINGTAMTVNFWSNTAIAATIPASATSGHLLVTVGPSLDDSNFMNFTVTPNPLPAGWLDQDIGIVGLVGSATYSNETFTVTAAGQTMTGTSDKFHFAYLPLSGDGSMIARYVSHSGASGIQVALMIRESLAPGATDAYVQDIPNSIYLFDRPSTNASTTYSSAFAAAPAPYWLKVTRSGSTFNAYISTDGVDWTAATSGVTVSMAQNAYIGFAVTSSSTTSSATATFDNVEVNSASAPAPVITSVSATTGPVGSEIAISGSNFGATQGNSLVTLNSAPVTINSWSASSIIITIPTGATSGELLVSVAPTMDESNFVNFTVTSQPLPIGWLDGDVGTVGLAGSATYSSGTFTVSGAGASVGGTADAFHLAYQPMSGNGSIVARLVSFPGQQAGVMIRETLASGSNHVYLYFSPSSSCNLASRSSTGGSTSYQSGGGVTLPRWFKLVRAGTSFSGFLSTDGVNWTQFGTSVTVSMAQNVYIGMAVSSNSTSTLRSATFDNAKITIGTTPYLSGLSPLFGGPGTSVTIAGSNFGGSQGTSTVTFSGTAATSISSWSDSQIVAVVPGTIASGQTPVVVTVNSIASTPTQYFRLINPVITSLAPPAGPLGGQITVNGSGFNAASGGQVFFNAVPASTVASWTDTSVTVTVPQNATSGPVTITEDGITSNSAQFTVIESISVTGISPTSGPIGSTVTITGTGFGSTQSNSVASFYGAAANVTSWSDTSIVTTVAAGTSTGNVTVAVAGNTAQGPVFTLTSGVVTLTDSLGNSTTYKAHVTGGHWQVTDSQGSGCSSCTQRGTIHITYESNGNALTRTDELGRTTTYTYDSNNNVLSISQPDGNGNTPTTSYSYNSFGEVLTVTDPLGKVTTNTYDTNGNLLSVTTPRPDSNTAASVTQFAYNSLGELTQITDPLSHNTTLTYTSAGLIATIKDAQNNVTTYGYDTHGNRTSVTDALNHQTTFAYDTGDRLKTITYPDTTTTTFIYDSRGRRTSVTDQNGKTTTYAYDDADRLTSVTDAANHVTTYGYDTENNLTSIKDANNNTTSFTYDAFGRVTKTTFPSGYIETYNYDAVGNLTSKTDRKNQLISYAYDGLNRLTQKSYPDTTTVNYTYDLDSRLTQVTDPSGTYQFTFDNMGRLTSANTSYAFLTARNFTTGYSYDAASNRTGFTDPENGSTTFAYDTLNRLQTLTPPTAFSATGSFGFSYDALSRRTQMTRPNNVATNYAYDNLSRLQSVLHQLAGSTIDGATYTVDNAGNRMAKTDQRAAVTSNYGYDAIYELTGVTQGTNTTESYTYDPVGNRLSSLGVSPYNVNVSNQLTSTPSTSYTYDYNGNTLTKVVGSNTTTYAWDFENRLTSVTLPGSGGTVSFRYDPFGRRIYKSSSTATSIYAYDGDNLIEETNSSGAAVARYSQTQNIDEPLAMLRSGATSYYHADGLGSVTSLSNAAGALAQTYTFDSFGKQTASSGFLTNPFQYTARESDTETGLYYYRSRYMDASTGRFIGEDPIAFLAGTNFYAYVENDPVGWADPTGQQKCKKCGIKKGPEYNVSGTVRGATPLRFHAEFLNDDEHSPSCCEVRQLISWTQGGPPNHGGFPGNFQSGQWYEDRNGNNCRYGRRTGPFACLGFGPGNNYNGNNYDGADYPNIHHHVLLGFRLIVVDICQGGKTIYTSNTIHEQF